MPSAWRSRRRLVSNSAKTSSMSKKALPVALDVSTGKAPSFPACCFRSSTAHQGFCSNHCGRAGGTGVQVDVHRTAIDIDLSLYKTVYDPVSGEISAARTWTNGRMGTLGGNPDFILIFRAGPAPCGQTGKGRAAECPQTPSAGICRCPVCVPGCAQTSTSSPTRSTHATAAPPFAGWWAGGHNRGMDAIGAAWWQHRDRWWFGRTCRGRSVSHGSVDRVQTYRCGVWPGSKVVISMAVTSSRRRRKPCT